MPMIRYDDPVQVLTRIDCPQGDHRLLRYAVACCRLHDHHLRFVDSQEAINWADAYSHGRTQKNGKYCRIDLQSELAAFKLEYECVKVAIAEWCEHHTLMELHGQIPKYELSIECRWAYFAHSLMHFDDVNPFDPTLSHFAEFLSLPLISEFFDEDGINSSRTPSCHNP